MKFVEIHAENHCEGYFAGLRALASDLKDLRRSAYGCLVVKWYVDNVNVKGVG